MACDASTLVSDSRCLAAATSNDHQLLAIWAYLLCSGGPTPPPSEGITTDPGPGSIITIEGGDIITPD